MMPNGMICAAEVLRVADDPVDSAGPDACTNVSQLTVRRRGQGPRSQAGLDAVGRL